MRLPRVAAFVAMALSAGGLVCAQSLINGDFEEPPISRKSFKLDPEIPGWTIKMEPREKTEICLVNEDGGFGAECVAQQGSQWLEMGGGQGRAYVEQMVGNFKVGASYELVGYYCYPARPESDRGHFKIEVVEIGEILNQTRVPNTSDWIKFNAPFTATSTNHTLRIVTMGSYAGVQLGVDNLAIVPKSPKKDAGIKP